jgi:hypothetical protein
MVVLVVGYLALRFTLSQLVAGVRISLVSRCWAITTARQRRLG